MANKFQTALTFIALGVFAGGCEMAKQSHEEVHPFPMNKFSHSSVTPAETKAAVEAVKAGLTK